MTSKKKVAKNGNETPEYRMLTPTQYGLIAESTASERTGVNTEQVYGVIKMPLQVEKFQQAWQAAAAAFDALRIQICWNEAGVPEQSIADAVTIPMRHVDLRTEPGDPIEKVEGFLDTESAIDLDLNTAPLCRVSALTVAEDYLGFVFSVHHSVIDGNSFAQVVDYVFRVYQSLLDGSGFIAQHFPQFVAFLDWRAAWDATSGIAYYKTLLKDFSEPTQLPAPMQFFPGNVGRSREISSSLSTADTKIVLHAARENGVTPNTMIQFAWGVLLSRYCATDDVVFGAVWAGRSNTVENANQIVGPFINTLPVRVTIGEKQSVRDGLQALRRQHVESRPWHHTSLTDIKSAGELDPSQPLFNTIVLFEYEHFDSVLVRRSEICKDGTFGSRSHTSFAISLAAACRDGRLQLLIEYNPGEYTEDRAQQILDDYMRLLKNTATNPDHRIHELKMLSDETYARLITRELAKERKNNSRTILDNIIAAAQKFPHRTAIHEIATGNSVTYEEMLAQTRDLAHALLSRGVTRGDIVGVMVPRSIPAILSMLAAHSIGAAFLTLDPTNPKDRLEYMLEDSKAKCVLIVGETAGKLTVAKNTELRVDEVQPYKGENTLPSKPVRPSDLAYVIYTSGSTGIPKGVCIPHKAICNHQQLCINLFELSEEDRVLQFAAHSFDASLEEIFPTLAAGAALVLRRKETAVSAGNFISDIVAARISVLNLPTAFWHQMVVSDVDWPSRLRLIVVGGERTAPELHKKFRSQNTGYIRWLNTYGPTESTISSTWYDDVEGDHDETDVPIGRPVAGLSHFALDHHLRPVPPGATGQLFIGGIGLATGYLFRPELTRERFVPHPWKKNARVYATGDRVSATRAGNWRYVDRNDNQVKIRGFRIELGEIENCFQKHPSTNEVVVVVHKNKDTGPSLAAFIAGKDTDATAVAFQKFASASLPSYMVPGRIVVLPELPKTPAGKIDRLKLAEIPVEPLPQSRISSAPAGHMERQLLKIWSTVLKRDVSDVNISFFDLGGDSLTAFGLFNLVERQFECMCNPSDFFEEPTVSNMAELIMEFQRNSSVDFQSLIKLADGQDDAPPIFLAPVITGTTIPFLNLAKSLGDEFPIYALQPPGMSSDDSSMQFDDMISFHVDQLKSVQPSGPYSILGYSSGGVVAFAVAERMVSAGEQFKLVGLLDATPPATVPVPSPYTSPKRIFRMTKTAVGRVREISKQPGGMKSLLLRGKNAIMRNAAKWLPFNLKENVRIEDLFVGAELDFDANRDRMEQMQVYLNKILNYVPTRQKVDLVLFRSHLDPFDGPHEPTLGWDRITTGKVSVEMFRLRHEDILAEKGMSELSPLIKKYHAGAVQ